MINLRNMSGGNRSGRGRGILGQYYPPGMPSANMGHQAQGYSMGYYGDGGGYAGSGGYTSPGMLDRSQETQLLQLLKRQSDVIERLSEQVGLDNMPLAPKYPGARQDPYANYGHYDYGGYPQDYQYMEMGYAGNYQDYHGMHGHHRNRGGRMQHQRNQDHRHGNSQSRKQTKKGKAGYPMKLPVNIEPGEYEDSYTFYCHACKYQCANNADRKNHNKGHKHLQRMEEVNRMPKHQAQPILDKIAEVKALREKEKKLMACTICDIDLTVPYSDHKNQNQHKNRVRQVKSGCGCCKSGAFKNFTELKDHRQTEDHKQNAEIAKEKLEAEIEKCTDENSFPAFEEGTPIGQSFIQKVVGFYCSLCKKFFLSEQEAMIEHCGVKAHYNKVKLQKTKPEEDGATGDSQDSKEADKSDSASATVKDEATD